MSRTASRSRNRLAEVLLDEATIPRGVADRDHERAVAIFDLVEDNSFGVRGRDDGPYSLTIAQSESRLTFDVRSKARRTVVEFAVSMTPFRPLLKDYFLVCETYYSAIRHRQPAPDRGDRSRALRASQRGGRADRRAHGRQGRDRRGHRAPPVHSDLRSALEDMSRPTLRPRRRSFATIRAFSPRRWPRTCGCISPTRPSRCGRRPRRNWARSACRRRSGLSPGRAGRRWRVTSATIPNSSRASACSTSPPAPGSSRSPPRWPAPRAWRRARSTNSRKPRSH